VTGKTEAQELADRIDAAAHEAHDRGRKVQSVRVSKSGPLGAHDRIQVQCGLYPIEHVEGAAWKTAMPEGVDFMLVFEVRVGAAHREQRRTVPMRPKDAEPFEVGDEVTRHSRSAFVGRSRSIHTVTRVLKSYLVLKDGSKWKLDGRPHPRRSGFGQPHIEHTTAEDRLAVEAESRRARIRCAVEGRGQNREDVDLYKLSLAQLRRICVILDEDES
jgi:hypothetical protein